MGGDKSFITIVFPDSKWQGEEQEIFHKRATDQDKAKQVCNIGSRGLAKVSVEEAGL